MDRRLGVPHISAPVRIARMSGLALTAGVEDHEIDHVRIRTTGPARMVVDCFKFRNKIGSDVALEALKNFRRLERGANDELWAHAEALRMSNVIRLHWAWLR